MSKKKILFVSHDASRTGAPLVLLHFLKWLKQNTDIAFVILLKRGGELQSEFEALAPTYIYSFPYQPIIGLKGKIIANWNTYIGIPSYYNKLRRIISQHSIGLIYANSVGNGHILNFLSDLKCPVITHIHELAYGIYANGEENLKYVLKYTNHYIAVSKAVQNNLLASYTIPEINISLVYEFVPNQTTTDITNNKLRSSLGIPEDAFIVGTSGTMDLRKGFDLFITLANIVHQKADKKDIYFIWIGGNLDNGHYEIVKMDAEKTGIKPFIRIPGAQKNPLDFFVMFDVFVLLSREDPFPLVCLENALLQKPIICFENGGGMPELVENDCGFVVPYLDINSIADKILYLKQNPAIKHTLGKNAQEKVSQRYELSICAPQIVDIIKKAGFPY
ncbi:glycosyltransferase [Cytophagaceae bacterium YF14B1]|uniref:Glycosyltransferase n=1 Tax=Xanthocytophaga flava TaxID=3048013 RepID=A0AAE3QSE5_9BACT|nr:glycosyltransferase [Xanthocytophaga flavus]MDJ1482395.1 glycosyltransferase [Xanthocytophaga flavus]